MAHTREMNGQATGVTRWAGVVTLAVAFSVAAGELHAQVYVTDSPTAADLVASAEDRLSKDEPNEAARLLQRVLDEHGSRLLEIEEGRYAEAHHVAAALLASDAELLRTYRDMHGATAARQLERAGNDRRLLGQVWRRYPATEAALEAGLREAGLALAAADAEAAAVALRSLADHPSLDDHRTRFETLVASAALLLEDESTFTRHRDMLQDRGDSEAVTFLDGLEQSLQLPRFFRAWTPMDTLPEAPVPQVRDEPLWRHATDGAENYMADVHQVTENNLERMAAAGRFLNTMYVVWDGVVYVNDGRNITALDSSSGMEVWRRELEEEDSNFRPLGGRFQAVPPEGLDLSGITAGSGRVAAIQGYDALVSSLGRQRGGSNSNLIVFDAATGEPQWQIAPGDIFQGLDDGFWYGQPIIHQDRVYAMLRRRQRTQFQDAYVVSVDLAEGDVVWRRHIASTAVMERHVAPGLGHLLLHDGDLYVDSRIGSVARLSARDGSIKWLSLLPFDAGNRPDSYTGKPWLAPRPILTDAGLVLLDDWQQEIYIVDPDTGERLRTISASEWDDPLYLMAVGGDVLAIGGAVRRVDGRTLEMRWRYPVSGDHLGRAAVAENRVLVPVEDAVEVVDLSTGDRVDTLNLPLPATLMVVDGQVLAAGRDELGSYSSWELASAQMESRIEANPDDPRPRMAKAWLAFNTGRDDALLGTLDEVIERVRVGVRQDQDRTLFDQVMAMTREDRGPAQLRRQLFQRAAVLASDVEQEVELRLARGAFHEEQREFADAMEQYQALLEDAAYRQQLYEHEEGARQAGLEALRRVQALVAEHGRELYEPYEAFAARQLERLEDEGDPAPLIELAEAYPMAEVAPRALRMAARRSNERGQMRQALGLLRQAVQVADRPDELARIYGLQAVLFEEAGQPHRARHVLRTFAVIHPGVDPVRNGEPVDLKAWLESLSEQQLGSTLAQVNLPLSGEARSVRGRIVRPSAESVAGTPTGMWLFRRRADEQFELRRGEQIELAWDTPMHTDDAELLSLDHERVWIWHPSAGAIRSLDASDGSVVWEEPSLRDRLSQIEPPDAGQDNGADADLAAPAGPPGQMEFRARGWVDEPLVEINGSVLAAADRQGRLAVFDSESGELLWKRAVEPAEVTALATDGRHVVVAGSTGDSRSVVAIYDAADGELRHQVRSGRQRTVQWMQLSEDGQLFFANANRVEAFDVERGQRRWISEPVNSLSLEHGAWLGPDRLVARTGEGDLMWLDLSDGQVVGRLPVRGTMRGRMEVRHDAGVWFITGNDRLTAADNNGDMLWQDAVTDSATYLDHVLTDRYLISLAVPSRDPLARRSDSADARRLYAFDRETGEVAYEQDIEAPADLIRIAATDNRLLLSGPDMTIILDGSP